MYHKRTRAPGIRLAVDGKSPGRARLVNAGLGAFPLPSHARIAYYRALVIGPRHGHLALLAARWLSARIRMRRDMRSEHALASGLEPAAGQGHG